MNAPPPELSALAQAHESTAPAAELVLAISRHLDNTYPDGTDPELVMWRRCTKVSEEAGEVQKALRGMTGENPRKGVTHTQQDLTDELLDCAVAALCAIEHLLNDGTSMQALDAHIRKMADRLRVMSPTLDPHGRGEAAGDTGNSV